MARQKRKFSDTNSLDNIMAAADQKIEEQQKIEPAIKEKPKQLLHAENTALSCVNLSYFNKRVVTQLIRFIPDSVIELLKENEVAKDGVKSFVLEHLEQIPVNNIVREYRKRDIAIEEGGNLSADFIEMDKYIRHDDIYDPEHEGIFIGKGICFHNIDSKNKAVLDVINSFVDAVHTSGESVKESGDVWVQVANPTYAPLSPPAAASKGSVWVKLDSAAGGASYKFKRYNTDGTWESLDVKAGVSIMAIEALLGANNRAGNHAFASSNNYFYYRTADAITDLSIANATDLNGRIVTVSYTSPTTVGIQTLVHTFTNAAALVTAINANTPLAAVLSGNTIAIKSLDGRRFQVVAPPPSGTTQATIQLVSTDNWVPSRYYAQLTAPTRVAPVDTLWYDNSLYADVMINDGGRWRGLQSVGGKAVIGPASNAEIQIRQGEPTAKATGGNLEFGDMWIDPTNGTDYMFYQYSGSAWVKLDSTDQSTTRGVLFADARCSNSQGIGYYTSDAATAKAALMVSDYVDPTCPDPRLYPRGMVLVNLAQTGGVVRKYSDTPFAAIKFNDVGGDSVAEEYFVGDSSSYELSESGKRVPLKVAPVAGSKTNRWVTASGTAMNGAGLFATSA